MILTFDEGEILTIWHPAGVSVQGVATLTVLRAERVRWEWHYYGKAKTENSRMFIEYVVQEGKIHCTSNRAHAADQPATLAEPAVQLFGM